MILLLQVRASVCICILDGKVFHTTEVRKRMSESTVWCVLDRE